MKNFKSTVILLLSVILIFMFCSCTDGRFGDIGDTQIAQTKSQIYTEAEIDSAIKTIKNYFKLNFVGCKLLSIGYAGDDSAKEAKEWAKTYESDKAIILTSDFEVDSSGGDGSLNPNSTYTEWTWILVKDNNGRWKHADH